MFTGGDMFAKRIAVFKEALAVFKTKNRDGHNVQLDAFRKVERVCGSAEVTSIL